MKEIFGYKICSIFYICEFSSYGFSHKPIEFFILYTSLLNSWISSLTPSSLISSTFFSSFLKSSFLSFFSSFFSYFSCIFYFSCFFCFSYLCTLSRLLITDSPPSSTFTISLIVPFSSSTRKLSSSSKKLKNYFTLRKQYWTSIGKLVKEKIFAKRSSSVRSSLKETDDSWS